MVLNVQSVAPRPPTKAEKMCGNFKESDALSISVDNAILMDLVAMSIKLSIW